MTHKSLSLKYSLLIPIFGCSLLILALFEVVIYLGVQEKLVRDSKIRSEVISYSIKNIAEISGDSPKLHRAVMAFGTERDVDDIAVVLDADKKIISANRTAWRSKKLDEIEFTEDLRTIIQKHYEDALHKDIWLDKHKDNEFLFLSPFWMDDPESKGKLEKAYVIIKKDTTRLKADLLDQLVMITLFFVGIMVLFSAFIYWLLNNKVFKPLAILTEAIRTSAITEKRSVPALADNEIGTLANELNHAWTEQEKTRKELELILNHVPALIFYKDTNNNILRLNEAAAKSLGMTVEEAEGKSVNDLFPTVARKYHDDDLEVIQSGQNKLGTIEEYIPKGGEKRWIQTDKVPYRDDTGEIIGIIALVKDITEEIQNKEQLLNIQKRLRVALEAAKAGVWSWDIKENSNIWDETIESMYGLQPGSFAGSYEAWARMVHPYDMPAVQQAINKAIDDIEPYNIEYRIIRVDNNQERIIAARGIVLHDDDNKPCQMTGVCIDITEKKRNEQRLRESQHRLDLALKGGDLGLWDWNLKTGNTFFNNRWFEMLGYKPDELDPHIDSWLNLIHPEDKAFVLKRWEDHVRGKIQSYEVEHRVRSKTGDWKWILGRGKIVSLDAQQKPDRAVGTHLDVTERKNAEIAINKKNKDLEMILYVISHDLREPLRAIENFSTMLQDEYESELNEEASDYLYRICRGVKRMSLLLNDIMSLSRAKTKMFNFEETNITICIQQAILSLEAKIDETHTKITIGNGFPLFRLDSTWIIQVFYNLINNAIKFAGDKEPDIEIKPYSNREDNVLVHGVEISDRGIGVPESARTKIFDLFQRAVGRDVEGTGAGLAIVRQIIERHNGKIWVESRDGGGSRFIFTLSQS